MRINIMKSFLDYLRSVLAAVATVAASLPW